MPAHYRRLKGIWKTTSRNRNQVSVRQMAPGGQILCPVEDACFREKGPHISNVHSLNPGFI